jgi:hypothetical protein
MSPFAAPLHVESLADCYFYHSMSLPGVGEVAGEWDLRGREPDYLGHADFRGKRVLEMGTASGFLCFYMERQGAEVIGYDLSSSDGWDVVPYHGMPPEQLQKIIAERKAHIARLNNGWWFAHRAYASHARVVYGSIYDVPESIGPVDVTTFTSILLHVRDPFRALEAGARLSRKTIVVTELIRERRWLLGLAERLGMPYARFLPNPQRNAPWETWWSLTPEIVRRFVRVLGFPLTRTSYFTIGDKAFFSVVAERSG